MAMKTSYLIGLLAVGMLMLLAGWPWWLGLGIIILSMAVAMSDSGAAPQQAPLPAALPKTAAEEAPRPKTWREREAETEAGMADVEDLVWRPSVLADGLLGLNPMSVKGEEGQAVSVGSRSGTLGIDAGPVRFKDDLRFRPTVTDKEGMGSMMTDPYTGKPISAWHFRTRKPVFYQKTKMMEASLESPDADYWDWMNVPPWKRKKDQR